MGVGLVASLAPPDALFGVASDVGDCLRLPSSSMSKCSETAAKSSYTQHRYYLEIALVEYDALIFFPSPHLAETYCRSLSVDISCVHGESDTMLVKIGVDAIKTLEKT